MNQLQKDLVATKALLMKGWIQEDFVSDDGYCFEGAIRMVTVGDPYGCNARTRAVKEAIEAQINGGLGIELEVAAPAPIPQWNDRARRTFEEVIAVIDRALLATLPSLPPRRWWQRKSILPPEFEVEVEDNLVAV